MARDLWKDHVLPQLPVFPSLRCRFICGIGIRTDCVCRIKRSNSSFSRLFYVNDNLILILQTLPSAIYRRQARKAAKSDPDSSSRLLSYENGPDYGSSDIAQSLESQIGAVQQVKREDDVPPPFRALLVRQVLIPLSIYAFLAFTDMSCQVLQPLFYSTSISLGGLGFDPYRIGVVMGTWGFVNAAIQFTFLGRFLRKFGPKIVLVIAVISYISVLGMYPFLSYLARRAGRVDGKVWTLLVIQLMFGVTTSAGYGTYQLDLKLDLC